ncbi:MAG: fused MFS/spermidine synthase [Candidatus Omnitrophota bacterium]
MQLTSLLSFVFFFSGFSSLIYQIVWQRLLTISYGVGAVSVSLIVSIFMAGLGLGALMGGYLAEKIKDKIRLYFIIQLAIGVFGLVSLPFLDFLGRHTAGSGYFVAFLYMSSFLFLPTFLMGMTLPVVTKIFNSFVRDFRKTVGFLYFINTLGAALGALSASYFFISFWGLDGAIYIATGINFFLAALIYRSSFLSYAPQENTAEVQKAGAPVLGRWAYPIVFVTGFLAIGYEIIWMRVIGVLVKESAYTFPSILAIYLTAIALGSLFSGKKSFRAKLTDPRKMFFWIQFLIGLSVIIIFIGYYYFTKYTAFSFFTRTSFVIDPHPYPLLFVAPFSISMSSQVFMVGLYGLLDLFFWSMFFVFIPGFLMGMSFPLVASLALRNKNREGETVGLVYFFNVLGNVCGGILTGFFLLPYWGTERILLTFAVIGMAFGWLAASEKNSGRKIIQNLLISACVVSAIFFFPQRGELYKLIHGVEEDEQTKVFFEEGINGVVLTTQRKDYVFNFINGVAHGGRPGYRFYADTIQAAAAVPHQIRDVLIIGYGTGSTMEIVLKLKEVEKVTLVEINRALMKNLSKMPLFQKLLSDKRINIVIDDGRRFLLRTDEKFDLILIDPLKSRSAYSNNLYSRQFFEMISQHLKPGGVFQVWMDELEIMPSTLTRVFKYVQIYITGRSGAFCLGSQEPLGNNTARFKRLLGSFKEDAFHQVVLSYPKYLGNQDSLRARYPLSLINEDWRPYCEYYLGRLFFRPRSNK